MNEIKKIYFVYPLFLAFLLVISNLLSANIFVNSDYTFLVWFVLMLTSFFTGWLMNSGFKWEKGIKIIFIVILISIVLSLIIVVLFRNSFNLNSSLLGNLILYSLRVFILGTTSIFGVSVAENITNKNTSVENVEIDVVQEISTNEKTEYLIKEAKLKAEKIIFEAEKEATNMQARKKQIEIQLRELIHTEREVIRKYENIGTSDNFNIQTNSD